LSAKPTVASEPIAISINGPLVPVRADSDVNISVSLTNISDSKITIPRILNSSDAEFNYPVVVTEEKRIAARDTQYGISMKHGPTAGSRAREGLLPNASALPENFLLNKLFVLMPGPNIHGAGKARISKWLRNVGEV